MHKLDQCIYAISNSKAKITMDIPPAAVLITSHRENRESSDLEFSGELEGFKAEGDGDTEVSYTRKTSVVA